MGNPFVDRMAAGGKNPHGKKSEKRTAKKMGAKLHSNSGSTRGSKSDASLQSFRLEMKSTTTQAIILEMAWLVKIAHEALDNGQAPAVTLAFVDADGKPRMKHYAEWVAMPMALFQELTNEN